MKMFRIIQEIDYASAQDDGRGATSAQMFRIGGLEGSGTFTIFTSQLLLTIDMIVDMGGRPLVEPNGMDTGAMTNRERMIANLDSRLRDLGMD